MAHLFAVSDIHGELNALREALTLVDLGDRDNKLILLGDYINRGDKSRETLYFIKELCGRYPKQVVALRGNHEESLLEELDEEDFFITEADVAALKHYLPEGEVLQVAEENRSLEACHREMVSIIKARHGELIKWLKGLPYYYETKRQIFIHAGVDEEAGAYWKWGSEEYFFVSKYPIVTGSFYKDIIAGHVATSAIVGDENYNRVYWDGANHFYIDGNTPKSKLLPVLKYDTATGRYSGFEKETREGSTRWREYFIAAKET